jgi:hypothetical protein
MCTGCIRIRHRNPFNQDRYFTKFQPGSNDLNWFIIAPVGTNMFLRGMYA